MTGLRIGNTRAWYIPGTSGGLLADTGYAGTLPLLYGAMKENGLRLGDIGRRLNSAVVIVSPHSYNITIGILFDIILMLVKFILKNSYLINTSWSKVVHFGNTPC